MRSVRYALATDFMPLPEHFDGIGGSPSYFHHYKRFL